MYTDRDAGSGILITMCIPLWLATLTGPGILIGSHVWLCRASYLAFSWQMKLTFEILFDTFTLADGYSRHVEFAQIEQP